MIVRMVGDPANPGIDTVSPTTKFVALLTVTFGEPSAMAVTITPLVIAVVVLFVSVAPEGMPAPLTFCPVARVAVVVRY